LKKHTKIYLDSFGFDTTDFVPSEISGQKAVDIHHIEPRGVGGSKQADRIENLQALTRQEHIDYGDKKKYKKLLLQIHYKYMLVNGVSFDEDYIIDKINKL
jgi:hypothetical protein